MRRSAGLSALRDGAGRLEAVLSRREFLAGAALLAAGAAPRVGGGPAAAAEAPPPRAPRRRELAIRSVELLEARGRRLTPVAPNAYAPYRGYEVREPLVRIRTAQGIEGVGPRTGKLEASRDSLKGLLGLDAFTLFEWDGDTVRGPAERHRDLLAGLHGSDAALFDLLGKAVGCPVAALLGKRCREAVPVYDSSLYMEDLLQPAEREGLLYLQGPAPADPAELVALKARWVAARPEGIRILKIKIGRAKWMRTPGEALGRDQAVVRAVRRAVGDGVALFVDGNDGYRARPEDALRFIEGVKEARLLAMEEMFPEEMVERHRELKRGMRAAGIATRLADGEGHPGGIPGSLLEERLEGPGGREPLFDINQPDMNQNGLLRMRALAAESARHGLTIAPHNFASRMGFYPQVHLGLVTPNWEFSEVDDSAFPAIEAPGIALRDGKAELAGLPGLGVRLRDEVLEKPLAVLEA